MFSFEIGTTSLIARKRTGAAIVAWGDSLTGGAGATDVTQTSYPAVAANLFLPKRDVQRRGVGGQGSTPVAARQGGIPVLVTVTGDELPALGTQTLSWDYSTGLQGWVSRNAKAGVSVVNGALSVAAVGGAAYDWDGAEVALGQTLGAGQSFTLSFDITVPAGMSIRCTGLNVLNGSYGGTPSYQTVTSSGSYSFVFTVDSGQSVSAISFLSDVEVGTYTLDNVVVDITSDQPVVVTAQSINILLDSGVFKGSATGTIAGVDGVMTTDTSGNWTFTRTAEGPASPCPPQTPFILDDALAMRPRTHWIWAGRNNRWEPETIKSDIAAMIAYMGHNRFLVASVTTSTLDNTSTINTITALNADLAQIYGAKFVDLLGLLQAAADGSAGDTEDVAAGFLPGSLRSDAQHPNDAGYAIIAEAMTSKTLAMGW
ncbi:MAG: hypothetical protein ACC631_03135 [Halocynthiibacter sp.]